MPTNPNFNLNSNSKRDPNFVYLGHCGHVLIRTTAFKHAFQVLIYFSRVSKIIGKNKFIVITVTSTYPETERDKAGFK